ncbi:hypothetical protein AU476_26305 [Cupriavidus sp. UYMSc13B]|nr:hypothetical protein AU476_26305 [Cupriavidus sp. UYMSc13B]
MPQQVATFRHELTVGELFYVAAGLGVIDRVCCTRLQCAVVEGLGAIAGLVDDHCHGVDGAEFCGCHIETVPAVRAGFLAIQLVVDWQQNIGVGKACAVFILHLGGKARQAVSGQVVLPCAAATAAVTVAATACRQASGQKCPDAYRMPLLVIESMISSCVSRPECRLLRRKKRAQRWLRCNPTACFADTESMESGAGGNTQLEPLTGQCAGATIANPAAHSHYPRLEGD